LEKSNPYSFPPGAELDSIVHEQCFDGLGSVLPYSTDRHSAEKVRVRLKELYGYSVSIGETRLRTRRYFARLDTGPSTATEVLAETLPLAICRLAVVVSYRRTGE
jgi:hypothetical protein